MEKQIVKVGTLLKTSNCFRAFKNILNIPAWFMPWKGFRVLFHKLRGTKIGKNVEIGYMVFVDNRYPELIEIKDKATVTSNCTLLAHDLSMRLINETEIIGKVLIKEGAFIGMNSTIMPGVEIGEYCTIGVGSVVTKSTEPYSVYVGAPAKKVKDLYKK